jgi:hypothetical protein
MIFHFFVLISFIVLVVKGNNLRSEDDVEIDFFMKVKNSNMNVFSKINVHQSDKELKKDNKEESTVKTLTSGSVYQIDSYQSAAPGQAPDVCINTKRSKQPQFLLFSYKLLILCLFFFVKHRLSNCFFSLGWMP